MLRGNCTYPMAKHGGTQLWFSTWEVGAEWLQAGSQPGIWNKIGRKLERASAYTQRLSFLCGSQFLKGKWVTKEKKKNKQTNSHWLLYCEHGSHRFFESDWVTKSSDLGKSAEGLQVRPRLSAFRFESINPPWKTENWYMERLSSTDRASEITQKSLCLFKTLHLGFNPPCQSPPLASFLCLEW